MMLKRVIPAIVWGVFIGFLFAMPGDGIPDLPYWKFLPFDKFAHGISFLIFSYLLAIGFNKQKQYPQLKRYGMSYAFLISLAYGMLLELLQFYIFVGRRAEWLDVLANASGSLLGLFLFYTIFNKVIVVK